MNFLEAIRIALQSLWANKLRSALTLLGVVCQRNQWLRSREDFQSRRRRFHHQQNQSGHHEY